MDDKQTHLEKWAMELQADNDRAAAAFERWLSLECGKTLDGAEDEEFQRVAALMRKAWDESRRQTLMEYAPRILIASEVAALIHKLDALQPKQ